MFLSESSNSFLGVLYEGVKGAWKLDSLGFGDGIALCFGESPPDERATARCIPSEKWPPRLGPRGEQTRQTEERRGWIAECGSDRGSVRRLIERCLDGIDRAAPPRS